MATALISLLFSYLLINIATATLITSRPPSFNGDETNIFDVDLIPLPNGPKKYDPNEADLDDLDNEDYDPGLEADLIVLGPKGESIGSRYAPNNEDSINYEMQKAYEPRNSAKKTPMAQEKEIITELPTEKPKVRIYSSSKFDRMTRVDELTNSRKPKTYSSEPRSRYYEEKSVIIPDGALRTTSTTTTTTTTEATTVIFVPFTKKPKGSGDVLKSPYEPYGTYFARKKVVRKYDQFGRPLRRRRRRTTMSPRSF